MEKIRIWSGGKTALPTVYIHSVAGDGHQVWEACRRIGCPNFNLVSVHDFDFEGELTPWTAPGVRKGQPSFKGNAERYLTELLDRIMPETEAKLPAHRCTTPWRDIHWPDFLPSGAPGRQTASSESPAAQPLSGTQGSLNMPSRIRWSGGRISCHFHSGTTKAERSTL